MFIGDIILIVIVGALVGLIVASYLKPKRGLTNYPGTTDEDRARLRNQDNGGGVDGGSD